MTFAIRFLLHHSLHSPTCQPSCFFSSLSPAQPSWFNVSVALPSSPDFCFSTETVPYSASSWSWIRFYHGYAHNQHLDSASQQSKRQQKNWACSETADLHSDLDNNLPPLLLLLFSLQQTLCLPEAKGTKYYVSSNISEAKQATKVVWP